VEIFGIAAARRRSALQLPFDRIQDQAIASASRHRQYAVSGEKEIWEDVQ
jgi:hypothetical protein